MFSDTFVLNLRFFPFMNVLAAVIALGTIVSSFNLIYSLFIIYHHYSFFIIHSLSVSALGTSVLKLVFG